MNKYIIIGATGLIGRKLTKELLDKGNEVIALGRDKSKLDQIFENRVKSLVYEEFYDSKQDYSDYVAINLAYARKSDFESVKDSIDFTYDITKKLEELNIKKYVYISSQSVYKEDRKTKACEDDLYYPTNLYGIGKVYLENWLEKFFKNSNSDLIILRLASIVGEGFEKRITARMTKSAIEDHKITVNDAGQVFSFVDIDEIVWEIIAISQLNNNRYQVYNLGSYESYSLTDIAMEISSQLSNKGIEVQVDKIKAGDYKNNSVDISRFIDETGYEIKYDLKNIIKREIERAY